MATLSTLRTRVAGNVGGRTDKNTQIDLFLNMAQGDLAVEYDFNDLIVTDDTLSLAIGEWYVTVPTTLRKVRAVYIKDASNNYWNPDLKGKAIFRGMWPEIVPITSGIPTECYMETRKIKFSHLADVAYTIYIDGVKYVTDMSADGDSPSITGVDDILVAQATGYLYAHLKQITLAQFWFGIASSKLKERKDELGPAMGQLIPY